VKVGLATGVVAVLVAVAWAGWPTIGPRLRRRIAAQSSPTSR
jgi:hypothetical protein